MKLFAFGLALPALVFLPLHPSAQREPVRGGQTRAASEPAAHGSQQPIEQLEWAAAEIAGQGGCVRSLQDQSAGGCIGASSVPILGSLYPLSSDFFVDALSGFVGLHTTAPQFPLDVAGTTRVDGSLLLPRASEGLRFPDVTGPSSPMIQMFETSTVNADRMILGHSEFFPSWGLKYNDASDKFVIQQSDTAPVMTVDMIQKNLQVHDGLVHVVQQGHRVQPVTLSVTWAGTSDIPNEVVRINRGAFTPSVANEDLIELELPSGSSPSSQYLEAQGWDGEVDFRVDFGGNVFADGAFTGPADFAEMFRVATGAETVEPGDVLEIDPASSRGVRRSTKAYSTLVAGIYSTKPGFVGSERDWDEGHSEAFLARSDKRSDEPPVLARADMAELYDEVPMAVVGVVPAKVSAENGAIQPGDLLVTASTPGHAMRADGPQAGTIVGKALEPLAAGTGKIRVLVTLQ
jgi:hypothetical protein